MFDLSPTDRDEILRVHDRWISVEREGRGLEVLDLCVVDVTWMVPGRDLLVGREAASGLLSNPTAEILELETSDICIQGSGRMAYKTSRYRTRFRVIDDGQEQISQGQHLWLLHKESDDRWRVAFVTWQGTEPECRESIWGSTAAKMNPGQQWWLPLYRFLIHSLVGTGFFFIVATPAILIHLTVAWLASGGVGARVIFGLQIAEYALFLADLGLFLTFIARTTRNVALELWSYR